MRCAIALPARGSPDARALQHRAMSGRNHRGATTRTAPPGTDTASRCDAWRGVVVRARTPTLAPSRSRPARECTSRDRECGSSIAKTALAPGDVHGESARDPGPTRSPCSVGPDGPARPLVSNPDTRSGVPFCHNHRSRDRERLSVLPGHRCLTGHSRVRREPRRANFIVTDPVRCQVVADRHTMSDLLLDGGGGACAARRKPVLRPQELLRISSLPESGEQGLGALEAHPGGSHGVRAPRSAPPAARRGRQHGPAISRS